MKLQVGYGLLPRILDGNGGKQLNQLPPPTFRMIGDGVLPDEPSEEGMQLSRIGSKKLKTRCSKTKPRQTSLKSS